MLQKIRLILFLLSAFITLHVNAQSIDAKIQQLLSSSDSSEIESLIASIEKENPNIDTLIRILKEKNYKKPDSTGILRYETKCVDGITRPFYCYVPESYNPVEPTTLIVYLHGAVSRKELISDIKKYIEGYKVPYEKDTIEIISRNIYLDLANQKGYILLFPLGQQGATWWDSVGVNNILSQIKITKSIFNIDDNRVFMSGFSDGASGSFYMAMTYPEYFAGFIPLNGYPAIQSEIDSTQLYFYNLYNSPLHVVNTDLDVLFPDSRIRPIISLAQQAGANIQYRIYTGIGHKLSYGKKEIPVITHFINTNPRTIHPSTIKWECSSSGYGKYKWLSIDKIDANSKNSQEHGNFNMDIVIEDTTQSTEVKTKKLFNYVYPSAQAEANFCANTFFIKASHLGAFSIYIHPEMVQLEQNVIIYVNGEKVFDENVSPDVKFLLKNFLQNSDTELMYVKRIHVDNRNNTFH